MQDWMAAIAQQNDEEAERLAAGLTPADAPALRTLATSDDADERWWAVRGLAVAGGPQCVETLVGRLQDEQPQVRAAAALALAHLYPRSAEAVSPQLEGVAALLADDVGYVRQAAADSLAMCGEAGVLPLGNVLHNSSHQGARTRAAAALRKIATLKAAAILYSLLGDENHLVRSYAYEGLDEMGLLENALIMPA